MSPIPDCVTDLHGQVELIDPVKDPITFHIQQHGLAGEFRLLTRPTGDQDIPPSTNLPLGLGEDYLLPHDLRKELEQEFFEPPSSFPPSLLPHVQFFYDPPTDLERQYCVDLPPAQLNIEFKRDLVSGAPIEWHASAPTNVSNSTSLNRDPLPVADYVRGKSSNLPFTPGGLPDPTPKQAPDLFPDHILQVPPGLTRGLVTLDSSSDHPSSLADLLNLKSKKATKVAESELLSHLMNPDSDDSEPEDLCDTDKDRLTSDDSHRNVDEQELDSLLEINTAFNLPVTAPRKSEFAHVVTDPMLHFHDLVPQLAHEYPFELDTFQKQAIYHLEQGSSVFVAAHTSAGKTVIAEYAITLARQHLTRAVYTSPIKALSNQKYRDFSTTYGDKAIGIITGDVQIHPEAGCLIMTTEILRSMLYKGADLIRDLEFVIIDEAHYLSDASRGVVWEEVIIMLPSHIQLILLSATVPNVFEFADWIGRTKKKEIFVISTTYRPVPLEHYLYVPSAKEYFKFIDADRNYLPDGIKKAHQHIHGIGNKTPEQLKQEKLAFQQARGGRGRGGATSFNPSKRNLQQHLDKTTWSSLIGVLTKRDLLPVTVFVFSRKLCEEYAECLLSKDLLTASEKSEVHVFVERAVSRLRPEDRQLPQIERMRCMMKSGIAVHHSGLLPLVKELVEILFARGIIKVLFATETFAMGVNMPTKCVVFARTRKHDGTQFRDLLPGEYTQMSGRAGRRGLDSTGMVLIMCVDEPQGLALHEMVLGTPKRLASQFRLTYNMMLNLLRVETFKVEEMMKRSFSENAVQKLVPSAELEYAHVQQLLDSIPPNVCLICAMDLGALYDVCLRVTDLTRSMNNFIVGHPVGAKALCTGRIVVVASERVPSAVGVLLNKQRSTASHAAGMLLSVFAVTDQKQGARLPVPLMQVSVPDECVGHIIRVAPSDIALVTPDTIAVNPDQLNSGYHGGSVVGQLREYVRGRNGHLDEYDWKKISDLQFQEWMLTKKDLMDKVSRFKARQCPDLAEHYAHLDHERSIQAQLVGIRKQLTTENLELMPEYHQRMGVLDQLGFIDARTGSVQLKGRVACEINTCDELVLTELMLNNVFAGLDVPETVALLSVLVFQEKSEVDAMVCLALQESGESSCLDRYSPALVGALRRVVSTAANLMEVQTVKYGIDLSASTLRFGMVEVAYEWAKGIPFCQIMALTGIHEGSIVRCIHRLADTCREVKDAARLIGDGELYVKMDSGESAIKRDIVFTGSLYI